MADALPLVTDPRDLLLGPDNDLVIGSDLTLTRGIPAVMQSCRIAMQMFVGEWFLNLDAGMPYWQSILGQKPALAQKAAAIAVRSTLLAVHGVIDVTKLEVTFAGAPRKLTIRWQVKTAFGETPVDQIAQVVGGGS